MPQPSSTTTSRRKRTALGALALGALVAAGGLELALRLAPVHAGMGYLPVNDANPVTRGAPGRAWVHSVGWSLYNARTGRLNNLGFNDPQTFEGDAPVIAVLGDSYVEAQAVPYEQSLQGRLRAFAGDCARVYGFGVSGAAPSDYVAYLQWARGRLDVRGAVVVLSDGDLWEASAPRPGMSHFVRQADGSVTLERTDREGPSPARDAFNRSTLYRYVAANLGFNPAAAVKRALAAPPATQDEEPASVDWTVDAFLDRLEAELPPERVTLVLDAGREAIAAGTAPEYGPERALLVEQARKRGFVVVDLDAAFRAHYARNGPKVDFSPMDGHWNGLGHRIAADNVAAAWRDGGRACPQATGRA